MKGLYGALALIAVVGLATSAHAQQVDGVNIVYPIHGMTYPLTGPGSGVLQSAYFASSFSVKCSGGPHTVKWGFDGNFTLGYATFYDQTSVQFVYKLPGGNHRFSAIAGCGKIPRGDVSFKIGQ